MQRKRRGVAASDRQVVLDGCLEGFFLVVGWRLFPEKMAASHRAAGSSALNRT
jgi:hypothetical protein